MSITQRSQFSSIDPEVLNRAKKEIGEDNERIEATLRIIREWLKKQPHLSCPQGKHAHIYTLTKFKTFMHSACPVCRYEILFLVNLFHTFASSQLSIVKIQITKRTRFIHVCSISENNILCEENAVSMLYTYCIQYTNI